MNNNLLYSKVITVLEDLALRYKRMLNDEYEMRGYTVEYFSYVDNYDNITHTIELLKKYRATGGFTR